MTGPDGIAGKVCHNRAEYTHGLTAIAPRILVCNWDAVQKQFKASEVTSSRQLKIEKIGTPESVHKHKRLREAEQ